MNEAIRFPAKAPTPAPPERIRKAPALHGFDRDKALTLGESVRKVEKEAKSLVEYARANREKARQAGIEIVTVEILAVMEGDRFQRVVDAVDELGDGKSLYITAEGLAELRSLEGLVAEAQSNLRRFGGALGSVRRETSGFASDSSLWIPVAILGVVIVAGIVAAASVGKRK